MKFTKENILNTCAALKSSNEGRYAKYTRNYRAYNKTEYLALNTINKPACVGLNQVGDVNPDYNVIKSCIDTLCSKMNQLKVRPFFNTIRADYKTLSIVRQAQQFFDLYYEQQDVISIITEAFRDACIFDTGCVYIDNDTKLITKANPWQIYIDPAENTYGKLTRVYYERTQFPTTILPNTVSKPKGEMYCTFGLYYDTVNNVKAYLIDNCVVKVESYNHDSIPFVFMHYNNPIIGNTSLSVVDMLYTIQNQIDSLMERITEAAELNPAMTIAVPEDSTIKVGKLNNKIGNVISYKPPVSGMNNPITVMTPSFISNQYFDLLMELKQTAYELVGVSQLSAQSKKPVGLDSGVALQTMENIESERFETQVSQIVRAYTEVAKICINVFEGDESILPTSKFRLNIKWSDMVKAYDKMTIQFSAAETLSKDPATKLDQLQKLAQAGVIPATRVASFLQIPDIEQAYSLSTNASDAVMTIIDDCIYNDNYDIPAYVPFTMLKEEILNTQLSMRAIGLDDNKEDIDKLNKLYNKVEEQEAEWQVELGQSTNIEEGQYGNVLQEEATAQQIPVDNGGLNTPDAGAVESEIPPVNERPPAANTTINREQI